MFATTTGDLNQKNSNLEANFESIWICSLSLDESLKKELLLPFITSTHILCYTK